MAKKYKIEFEILVADDDVVEKYLNDILQDMKGDEIIEFEKVRVTRIL